MMIVYGENSFFMKSCFSYAKEQEPFAIAN